MPASTIWRRLASVWRKFRRQRSAGSRRPPVGLRVEPLEDRTILSAAGLSAFLPPAGVSLVQAWSLYREVRASFAQAMDQPLPATAAPANLVPLEAHSPWMLKAEKVVLADLPLAFSLAGNSSFVHTPGRLERLELALSLREPPPFPVSEIAATRPTHPPEDPSSSGIAFEGNIPGPASAGPSRMVHPVRPLREPRLIPIDEAVSAGSLSASDKVLEGKSPPLSDLTLPVGGDTPPATELADSPPAGHLLLGVLPIDAAALERGIDLFLDRLEGWSLGGSSPGGFSLVNWGTVVAAGLALEAARRQVMRPEAKNPFLPAWAEFPFPAPSGGPSLAFEDRK